MNAQTPIEPAVDMLTAALDYAARGWAVFPCAPGEKHPITGHGYKDATTDAATIRAWWTANPHANIGLNLEASGLVALDADTYKPDCAWSAVAAANDVPATLTQRSARGGTHLLFRADEDARYQSPGNGIDLKRKGYILLEPSTFAGGTYQWQNDALIAKAPDWLKRPERTLAETVGNMTGRSSRTLAEVEDALQHVSADCDYHTWLSVLQALHDEFGKDGLMLAEEWSQRAPHRYSEGMVEQKFASFTIGGGVTINTVFDLARKAGADLGQLRHRHSNVIDFFQPETQQAKTIFDAITETGAVGPDVRPAIIRPSVFAWRDPAHIPPRQWLYGRHLIRGFLSVTVAPGALGKSSLITVETLAMVTGRDLLGDRPPHALRVWVWNGEDPTDELARRYQAACMQHGIGPDDLGDRLMIDSGRDVPIKIATLGGQGVKIAAPVVEGLKAAIKAAKVDVLIIDPFVTSHSVPENDNTAMNAVVEQWRNIAAETGCAIELVHHVSKAAAMDGDTAGIAGSRGAGALADGARSGRYLVRMSKDEGLRLGLEDHARYFRVHMGKENLAPADKAVWRKMVSVSLNNGGGHWPEGDAVGVCMAWTAPEATEGITEADREAILRSIRDRAVAPRKDEKATDWVGYLVADHLNLDVGRGLTRHERSQLQNAGRAKVTGLIADWLKAGALILKTERDGNKARNVTYVTARHPAPEDKGDIFG